MRHEHGVINLTEPANKPKSARNQLRVTVNDPFCVNPTIGIYNKAQVNKAIRQVAVGTFIATIFLVIFVFSIFNFIKGFLA